MKRAAVWIIAACGASACGNPLVATQPLDPAHDPNGDASQEAGMALASSVEWTTRGYEPADSGAGMMPGCVAPSGSIVDADLDHFPDQRLTFTFTGCSLGGSATLDGTVSSVDTALGSRSLDFESDVSLDLEITGGGGGEISVSMFGSRTGVESPSTGLSIEHHLATLTHSRFGSVSSHVSEIIEMESVFVPAGAWSAGDPLIDGSLVFTGSWAVDVDHRGAETTISTPVDLVLSASCATRIVAGTLRADYTLDAGPAAIEVTWNACGQRSVQWITP